MIERLLPAPAQRQAIANYAKEKLASHPGNLSLIILKNVLGSLLFMVPPFLSKYVLESVLPQQNWNWLVIVTLCMVAAPITGSMMIVLENVWGRFIIRLSGSGRAALYNGIQHQSIDWTLRNRIGDLLARTLDDTRKLNDIINGDLGFMLFHIVTIITGSAILLVLKPGLGAIVIALWALQAVHMTTLGSKIKRQAAETAKQSSLAADTVREVVSSAAFIKASGQEPVALGSVKDCLQREWEYTRRGIIADHFIRMLHSGLTAFVLVLMYAAGGWYVLHGQMTLGSLVAFIAVYNWLRPFGVSLIEMVQAVIRAIPAVDRVAAISFPVSLKQGGLMPQEPLTLEAAYVSFQYEDMAVLQDISFSIPAGSIVTIVGQRGSGKSTLSELLLGLRQPTAGQISLNGGALFELDRAWHRQHMLAVTQDVMLRSGTILDNILYGSDDNDISDVWEALRIAELGEWVSQLPEGLYTFVGEQALQISGGQRQRISIARALLRKPSILILDEAASSLDQRTERRIIDRMLRHLKGTTFLFITHRLDVALRSDEVFVMDKGRIVERGTHEDLLTSSCIYQELWFEQNRYTELIHA